MNTESDKNTGLVVARETDPKQSKVEAAKRGSDHLRGTLVENLETESTHFCKDDIEVLKFHGVYQQDDRDVRHENRKAGLEDAYQFMVRCSIPAGVVTADQYLNLDAIADCHANGSLRVTARQAIQFHGVIKRDLENTLAKINDKLTTTLAACGDVLRNVMACPAPLADEAHVLARQAARRIAAQLRPATNAYHEIWLDGEKRISTQEEEPFYGEQYLPRKFKAGLAPANDNCVDVYAYDLGYIALSGKDGRLIGFNVVVGGGLGMTHNKPDTFARLAEPLGFVAPQRAADTATAVAAIFRDFGNREDRRHARLKYLLAQRGIDWFRTEFKQRVGFKMDDSHPLPDPACNDHLGRHEQGNGRFFYGVFIENGRIKDDGDRKLKTGLRTIIETYKPGVIFTPQQNLLLTGLDEATVGAVERMLGDHGVERVTQLSAARRYSMACPALPTCGLALTESERIMPTIVERFEKQLASLGLRHEPISFRMTGCPNGCVRPYTADVAFVGRRKNVYHIYVGGGLPGRRVVDLYASDVHVDNLVKTLRPLLYSWASARRPRESLSDYYHRLLDRPGPRQAVTGREEPTQQLVELKVL